MNRTLSRDSIKANLTKVRDAKPWIYRIGRCQDCQVTESYSFSTDLVHGIKSVFF